MKEKRKFRISFFLVGDSQKSKRVFWEVYAWLAAGLLRNGGERFVLLFETITFGSPTGRKEIAVVVNH